MKIYFIIAVLITTGCSGVENSASAVFDNANSAITATTNEKKLWSSEAAEAEEAEKKKRARY